MEKNSRKNKNEALLDRFSFLKLVDDLDMEEDDGADSASRAGTGRTSGKDSARQGGTGRTSGTDSASRAGTGRTSGVTFAPRAGTERASSAASALHAGTEKTSGAASDLQAGTAKTSGAISGTRDSSGRASSQEYVSQEAAAGGSEAGAAPRAGGAEVRRGPSLTGIPGINANTSKSMEKPPEMEKNDDWTDEDAGGVETEEYAFGDAGSGSRQRRRFFVHRPLTRKRLLLYRRLAAAGTVVLLIVLFALYNELHTFKNYAVTQSYESGAASGTQYRAAGKRLYRYNADGITCITQKNEAEWNVTYSMETPIADVCGTTMAVAEQQGTQVYIVGEDGLLGNFETRLPILKARVSRKGMVALVLQDEDVTWVNLYQADGTVVASDKTTINDTGYPLDVAISPNGQKLMVSYLSVEEGVVKSRVVFYHFGSAGQSKEKHIVSSAEYESRVIPQVYFTDNSRAVAVSDGGFYVFRGNDEPEESTSVSFQQEIISTFHDDDRIGFLFTNTEDTGEAYRMELFDYSGKRKASRKVDAVFDDIQMQNGQILMHRDKGLSVFTGSGRLRFQTDYEKEVKNLFYFGEFRKYLIVTGDSLDKIRISG